MRNSTVFVDCVRDRELVATYDFLVPATLGPSVPPTDAHLVEEAKNNLTNLRLAAPPYEGITFKVRR